jgi:hypothetical protein
LRWVRTITPRTSLRVTICSPWRKQLNPVGVLFYFLIVAGIVLKTALMIIYDI